MATASDEINWQNLDISSLEGYSGCFCCGQSNPIGLKLKPVKDGKMVYAEFIPTNDHQGWPGIVHGGILCTLLDEVMAYTLYFEKINCITAKYEVRFRCLAKINEKITASAEVIEITKKLARTRGKLCTDSGKIIAEAIATMWLLNYKQEK